MIYELKDCRTGEKPVYDTTVEITEKDGIVKFKFTAHHTEYYCSGKNIMIFIRQGMLVKFS